LPPYRHTQVGYLVLALLGAMLLIVVVAFGSGGIAPAEWAALALFVLLALVFSRLTVELRGRADDLVRPRLPRWRWPLRDIASVRAVRNPWYVGWGIRWVGRYWVYNVSGLEAVEVTLRSGKRFRIGTDEPEALLAALQRARS